VQKYQKMHICDAAVHYFQPISKNTIKLQPIVFKRLKIKKSLKNKSGISFALDKLRTPTAE